MLTRLDIITPFNPPWNPEEKNSKNPTYCTQYPNENALFKLIENTWKSIPFMGCKSQDDLKQLSFFLVNELHKNLNDPIKHHVDNHYSKRKEYDLIDKKINPPVTFYLTFEHGSRTAKISINKSKSEFIRGAYKKISEGYNFFISCESNLVSGQLNNGKQAIARFLYPEEDSKNLIKGLKIHQKIYECLKNVPFSGHIAEPPILREHEKFDTKEKKYEFVQHFYTTDMFKVVEAYGYYPSETAGKKIALSLPKKLSLIEEILLGIDWISSFGYVHEDIKCENVFLEEVKGAIHAFISDFDFALGGLIGYSKEYSGWDLAGQMGLVSHYTDILGVMYLAIFFLYEHPLDENDFNHAIFKDPHKPVDKAFFIIVMPYINRILQHLKINASLKNDCPDQNIQCLENMINDPNISILQSKKIKHLVIEAKVGLKLMKLFCDYFAKEKPWKDKLVGSIVAYFSKSSAAYMEMNSVTIFGQFKKGYETYIKQRLMKELEVDKNIISSNLSLKQIFDRIGPSYHKNEQYEEIFETIYKEYSLFAGIKLEDIPKEGDPELYRLLSSKDPQEQTRGREIGYQFFGKASELQHEIHQIAEEIEADVVAV